MNGTRASLTSIFAAVGFAVTDHTLVLGDRVARLWRGARVGEVARKRRRGGDQIPRQDIRFVLPPTPPPPQNGHLVARSTCTNYYTDT